MDGDHIARCEGSARFKFTLKILGVVGCVQHQYCNLDVHAHISETKPERYAVSTQQLSQKKESSSTQLGRGWIRAMLNQPNTRIKIISFDDTPVESECNLLSADSMHLSEHSSLSGVASSSAWVGFYREMAQEHDHGIAELQQALQNSADNVNQAHSQKKRNQSDQGSGQRTKRNRYISIACNECKRRKIKCNGETPCQRCGNLNLECIYAPNCCSSSFKESNEFKQMNEQIVALQNEVNSLYHNINSLRSALGHELPPQEVVQYGYDSTRSLSAPQAPMVDPALTRPPKQSPHQPQFHGPTSSTFNLNLARSSLQSMGITGADDNMDDTALNTRDATPGSPNGRPLHPQKDPIWGLNRDEAMRLCQVYDDEMGLMYPIIDIQRVSSHANLLFKFIDATSRNGFMLKDMPGADALDDEETSLLKLVLANALVSESGGQSDIGRHLFENVAANNEARLRGNADLRTIRILTLTAMYHFHTDNEGLSWRVIGTAARLCLELGLHRAETYDNMKDEEERTSAIKLFWSIYNLDRRWSFGTGMSFALRESDLDANLPKPALELVRGLSVNSHVGKRLWRTIRSLKEIGPKLGLYARNGDGNSGQIMDSSSSADRRQSQQAQQDAHSSAAMAMAGLAGHPIDEAAFFATHQGGQMPSSNALLSPNGMANDLTSLFEAAGGYAMAGGQATAGSPSNDAQGDAVAALEAMGHGVGAGMAWGNEEELNKVMRDMF
ncbi:hypothetical protein FH972_021715 [Carpinus fangiana]|uniref:Zn(2)-C6 fungal-type domain-containing protein n=1 Tax=Carpinus fangiana TaxID=176857 RepID=A0A5N6KQH2_9ROSI|nr:hypothetical protein FH972_021715 [Carpinus fangiana]